MTPSESKSKQRNLVYRELTNHGEMEPGVKVVVYLYLCDFVCFVQKQPLDVFYEKSYC